MKYYKLENGHLIDADSATGHKQQLTPYTVIDTDRIFDEFGNEMGLKYAISIDHYFLKTVNGESVWDCAWKKELL